MLATLLERFIFILKIYIFNISAFENKTTNYLTRLLFQPDSQLVENLSQLNLLQVIKNYFKFIKKITRNFNFHNTWVLFVFKIIFFAICSLTDSLLTFFFLKNI